jgi:cell division protein FtsQ
MTTQQNTSRPNFIRQGRKSVKQPAKTAHKTAKSTQKNFHPASVYLPLEPRPMARQGSRQATRKLRRNGYDIAFTIGHTKVHAPALNLPQLGPRWVSAGMTLLLGFLLFAMWTASPFLVKAAGVRGNQRLDAAEINAVIGFIGEPIFKAIPSQIEANLRTAFSDLESISVHVGFPNHLIVDVVERIPVLAWYQDGVVTWVDANGVAFMPRGEFSGLIQVAANGSPIPVASDPALPLVEQKFIAPEMVQALTDLVPDVPAGMPMIFDPQYGMGWQDPLGWTVYFGQDSTNIPMKLVVYQAIVNSLTLQGVQPSLISVEYLNAPFYK